MAQRSHGDSEGVNVQAARWPVRALTWGPTEDCKHHTGLYLPASVSLPCDAAERGRASLWGAVAAKDM